MNVTRDVIYDLLPAYFSGDASQDTRALVEHFFTTDPELGRMAERFGKLMVGRPAAATADAERAKIVFDRARSRVRLRIAAIIWLLAAAFGYAMAILVSANGMFGWAHPGIIIGTVFTGCAVTMWLMSLSRRPEHWYAAFTGEDKQAGKPSA
jgi:anti-sigma factor RsiW